MKNSITSFVASGLVSCALAIGAATPSFAQSSPLVKADIPFAFQANGKLMPAGTYLISQQNGGIMRLNGSGKHAQAMAIALPDNGIKAATVSKVTFNKYGDHYFLHNVSVAGSTTSYRCTTTKQEKNIVRELRSQQPTEVAVNVIPSLR
jgi:hypothetical protein